MLNVPIMISIDLAYFSSVTSMSSSSSLNNKSVIVPSYHKFEFGRVNSTKLY